MCTLTSTRGLLRWPTRRDARRGRAWKRTGSPNSHSCPCSQYSTGAGTPTSDSGTCRAPAPHGQAAARGPAHVQPAGHGLCGKCACAQRRCGTRSVRGLSRAGVACRRMRERASVDRPAQPRHRQLPRMWRELCRGQLRITVKHAACVCQHSAAQGHEAQQRCAALCCCGLSVLPLTAFPTLPYEEQGRLPRAARAWWKMPTTTTSSSPTGNTSLRRSPRPHTTSMHASASAHGGIARRAVSERCTATVVCPAARRARAGHAQTRKAPPQCRHPAGASAAPSTLCEPGGVTAQVQERQAWERAHPAA
jgi:hypothetical protein